MTAYNEAMLADVPNLYMYKPINGTAIHVEQNLLITKYYPRSQAISYNGIYLYIAYICTHTSFPPANILEL